MIFNRVTYCIQQAVTGCRHSSTNNNHFWIEQIDYIGKTKSKNLPDWNPAA
ncbi:hypothetical protein NSQ20_17135 [Paenibacillus sp. FSL K6-1122]|uniref:hypothetical protein n=1 Tax=Paenibacillus sp. FSL K6-1122 TaxID=2954512 RepID=UPI0030EDD3CE